MKRLKAGYQTKNMTQAEYDKCDVCGKQIENEMLKTTGFCQWCFEHSPESEDSRCDNGDYEGDGL